MSPTPPGGGGALSYLSYTGMCRRTGYGFQGLESLTGYTILLLSVLNRVRSFWTGSLSKSVKTCDERSTFEIPIIVFLNIYFHDFSVKNYLILYAKQKNQDQKVVSPVLNRLAKWAIFVLTRVGVWRPRRHSSTQTFLECTPPPPGVQLA